VPLSFHFGYPRPVRALKAGLLVGPAFFAFCQSFNTTF